MIKEEKFYEKLENTVNTANKKLKERSFGDYLDISLLLIIIAIVAAIVLTFFVQFIFDPKIDWKDIGVNTVLLTACTIAVYLLVRYYAMRKGRKTQGWKEARAKMFNQGKRIIDEDRAKLIPKYCRAWESEHLESDITVTLAPVGITYKDFKEKYSILSRQELAEKYKDLTEYQIKTILKAQRIKRLHFDERYFYVNSSPGRRGRAPSSGLSTKQLNRITVARMVLTSVVMSFVSATILKDIIVDFSLASIIKCIIKLALIIFFGALAMVGGYSFTSVKETNEMNAKSDEIDVFLKWCDSESGVVPTEDQQSLSSTEEAQAMESKEKSPQPEDGLGDET